MTPLPLSSSKVALPDDELIREQIDYYERRAPEYDETSDDPGHPTAADYDLARAALESFAPTGTVLEIACGTGKRTPWLLDHADSVTALDASAAMLERAAGRVIDPRVRFVLADFFTWTPDREYDIGFFAFWLSHVPFARFEEFWLRVGRCLTPAGRVFFVDEGPHHLYEEEYIDPAVPLVRRRLGDGTEHVAVKVFWEPEELERRLGGLGWRVAVSTAGVLYFGSGHRRGC